MEMCLILKRLRRKRMDRNEIMKYAVDRIEGNIIILENIETSEKIEISTIEGMDAKEGDILIYENNTYRKDDTIKEERLNTIKEKMNKLRSDE